ncbi:hypothetical protein NEMBOFW57_007073 [Staphylotrichum longicolle]|uniref:Amidase domain-containing protein n=1 Tax=Staphylotrichum longicolle TaxID=669026 RepID=A0AAD4ETU2_9PEZI|nr:hypothetical protein NEMBOFW57_007073 [Staphylotrichum longicolle]
MAGSINLLTATISELQARLSNSSVTSKQLVTLYTDQIAKNNGYLKAVIAVAPEELLAKAAAELDDERSNGQVRGPLHGIPILIKDNIDTHPELGLPTTCGSLALVGSKPKKNAAVIERLIAAGAIILGKANLSALYTIKPTLKIVSQAGIIPVTPEADMAGPMAKSVLDLAIVLDAIVDPSKTTIPEGGYQSAVTGEWGDIRIGFVEPEQWLFPHKIVKYEKEASDQMAREWKAAHEKLATVVKVVKPVTLLSPDEATECGKKDINDAFFARMKILLEEYFASVEGAKVRTLEELIKFNEDHAEQELPASADNQAGLIRALNAKMSDEEYHALLDFARDRCGRRGIDKVLEENDVDIILGPGDGPLFSISGTAGYPVASLPLGYLDFNGRPFGMQIIAKAHQEALLIQAQSAWEATFPKRQPPPLDEIIRH